MFRRIILLVLACPAIASAQMVRGTVTDAATGAPIRTTAITLFTADGRRLGNVIADDDGKFELVLPKGRAVYVQAARIGYETAKSDVINATTSELLELNVRLSTAVIPLRPIEVVTRRQVDPRLREFMDRASMYQRAGIGRIWTRADLEKRRIALISQFVDRFPRRRELALSRGKQICEGTVLYIDNVRLGVEDDDATLEDLDLFVSPDQIEGIEMYRDTDVPPDLLMNIRRFNHTPRKEDIENGNIRPPDEAPEYFCMMVMIWRKPYSELNAPLPGKPVPAWRRVTTWLAVAGLFAVEQAIWR